MDNAEKNTYVKCQITNALLGLLKEKELKNISITEITATAQVGRVSFYRNYVEKEDVLKAYIFELFGKWTDEYDRSDRHSDDDLMGAMFGHLLDYKGFYLLLKRRGLSYLLQDVIVGICGPKPEYPNVWAYTAAYFSYGLYGWIEEWFQRGMQESPQEMVELLQSRQVERQ